ncbi:MAG: hypothetical protein J7539_06855 [Niabella sp.]|nr:hypothetical protein [Niabella sp.]
MKRAVFVIVSFLILVVFIYSFIPARGGFEQTTPVGAPVSALRRYLAIPGNLRHWWPGTFINDSTLGYKNCRYQVKQISLSGLLFTVFSGKDSLQGSLQCGEMDQGKTPVLWNCVINYSKNPVAKAGQQLHTAVFKNNIGELTLEIKKYFENPENIYGCKILKEKVTDSVLLVAQRRFNRRPGTAELYSIIADLKTYAQKYQVAQTNYPMLNINNAASSVFTATLALPIQKEIPSDSIFVIKKMVLGNILMVEVKGGPQAIEQHRKELLQFVNDNNLTSPAMPFVSLVTDRIAVPDSTQWITRLYYPVY